MVLFLSFLFQFYGVHVREGNLLNDLFLGKLNPIHARVCKTQHCKTGLSSATSLVVFPLYAINGIVDTNWHEFSTLYLCDGGSQATCTVLVG